MLIFRRKQNDNFKHCDYCDLCSDRACGCRFRRVLCLVDKKSVPPALQRSVHHHCCSVMRPRCRCSTSAYMDRAEFDKWLGFLDNGGTTEERNKQNRNKEEELAKRTKNGILNLKVASGAIAPYSPRAEKHAAQYYEFVRHMTTETAHITKNTGWKKTDIDKIKNHVFVKEHDLIDGHRRFDPSFEMAQSWQRLIGGKNIHNSDIILLLHEYLELTLMEQGYTQDEAHILASERYSYVGALKKEENDG